jgi:hypothetical protein
MRETSHVKYFFALTGTDLVSQTTQTPNSAPLDLGKRVDCGEDRVNGPAKMFKFISDMNL